MICYWSWMSWPPHSPGTIQSLVGLCIGVTKDRLDVAVASHLFYIAQEATRNAARHAHATAVDISLFAGERALDLAVVNDGQGLPPADARPAGMGLRIMAHRAGLVGGELLVGPGPDGGTAVHCHIPRCVQYQCCANNSDFPMIIR